MEAKTSSRSKLEALRGYVRLTMAALEHDDVGGWVKERGKALAAMSEFEDVEAVREFVYRTEGRLSWEAASEAAELLRTIRGQG